MKQITFGFIGLGLIGGSLAQAIKRVYGKSAVILAFDSCKSTLETAKNEYVVDSICYQIDGAFSSCDIIFLCAPVSNNDEILKTLKDFISPHCLITDVGSVKMHIHTSIHSLGLSAQFIGGHPMTGSEKKGYAYASDRLLENVYYILTPTSDTASAFIEQYEQLILALGSIPLILEPGKHDYITGAISHLPHIIAASLVTLIEQSDDSEGTMRLIAAGGFKDITRIASASPELWQQISLANRENISLLLEHYMMSLSNIQTALMTRDSETLYDLFAQAKIYRDSFLEHSLGPIKKSYLLHVDIPDEPGVIAAIATLLAKDNISLKNIGIVHNREFEEGALRIEFYEESALQNARISLQRNCYTIYS